MELKEYVRIIKRHKTLFWGAWITVAVVVFALALTRPQSYEATMSIDIARHGTQDIFESNEEYDFDQYYRLEADDKFASTVVQWLKDPGVVNSIYSDSKLNSSSDSLKGLSRFFKSEKLAPNYIRVKYRTRNPLDAGTIFGAAEKVIVSRTEALNSDSKDQNWFKTIFSGPVVEKKKIPWLPLALGAVFGGFLVAIFGVLVREYWKE